MVGVFVRLRLRLVRNRARGLQAAVALGLSTALIVGAGIVGAAVLAAGRFQATPSEALLAGVYGSALGMWLLPVLTFASVGNDLATGRFASFPLTSRQKVAGLLAARLVSAPGLAGALVVVGTVIGYAPAGGAAVVVAALAVAFLVVCVVVSRALVGVLDVLAQTRRARDVGIVLMLTGSLAYYGAARQFSAGYAPGGASPAWVRLSPPGAVAGAVVSAGRGDVGPVIPALAYLAVLTGLALAGWAAAVTREGSLRPSRSQVRAPAHRLALYPGVLRFLPRNRIGAVAAGDLRSFVRNPQLLYPYLWGSIYPAMAGGAGLVSAGPAAAFLLPTVALSTGMVTAPALFGADGPALWQHAVAAGRFRDTVYGKVLARAVGVFPLFVAMGIGLSIYNRTAEPLVAGIPMALGTFGVMAGCGAAIAVQRPNSTGGASGCMFILIVMVAEGALLLPGAVVVAVSDWLTSSIVPGALLAGVYGCGVGGLVLRAAGHRVESRLPEFLERIRVDA